MALSGLIVKNHYGDVSKPGSIAFNASRLGRKGVTKDHQDFHTADELIRHTFISTVRRASEAVLGSDADKLDKDLSVDDRNAMFSTVADKVVDRYYTKYRSFRKQCSAGSNNAALFLRDAALYLELSDAIKAGDIGRIEEVLVWLTIMFQAMDNKNYANELLRLHCDIRYSWTPEVKITMMSSWLINTSGRPNGWIPADLYQEHNNLLTKVIYKAKGSNASWEHLAKLVSTNIRAFGEITSRMGSEFRLRKNSSKHATVSAEIDIDLLSTALKEHRIFEILENTTPTVAPEDNVVDLLAKGIEMLQQGPRIRNFIKRNSVSARYADAEGNSLQMPGTTPAYGMDTDEGCDAEDNLPEVDPKSYIENLDFEFENVEFENIEFEDSEPEDIELEDIEYGDI
ncbi:hypothetical protein BGX26_005608 [Mortierella sp. AD094]|nr:hypothetical protein BGX26_005608 [Mortierella sp. AD094]